MCDATYPDTGLSIILQPGSRHIGAMAERATELNRPLPISISIGVDPAIEVGILMKKHNL